MWKKFAMVIQVLAAFAAASNSLAQAPSSAACPDVQLTQRVVSQDGQQWGYTPQYGWGRVVVDPTLRPGETIVTWPRSAAPKSATQPAAITRSDEAIRTTREKLPDAPSNAAGKERWDAMQRQIEALSARLDRIELLLTSRRPDE